MAFRTNSELGAEVKRLRTDREFSPAQLLERLDPDAVATPESIEALESRGYASTQLLVYVAEALGVPIDALLRDDYYDELRPEDLDDPAERAALEQADKVIDSMFYFRALTGP